MAVFRNLKEDRDLINGCDKLGETALHWSSKRGFINMTELLLIFNANPNQYDIFGRSPSFQA